MALHLNLYHEIQRQELQRRRDPLKVGIMLLLFVAVGFVAYYFWRLAAVHDVTGQLSAVQGEWSRIASQEKTAKVRYGELEQEKKLSDALVHKIENRFYWAPLLQQMLQVVPPEVQITRFDGNLAADASKKVSLTVNGIATGSQPRATAEALRTALADKFSSSDQQTTSVFKSLEDGAETVQYKGETLQTAIFAIDLSLARPDIDGEVKNEPQPRKKK